MLQNFRLFSIIFIVVLNIGTIFSQTVLLEEKVSAPGENENNIGPNKKHYTFFYFGFSNFIFSNADDDLYFKTGKSHAIDFGFNYKHKITNLLSYNLGGLYRNERCLLKNVSDELFLDSTNYDNDIIGLNYIGGESFFRINFDVMRGNILGKYIDIGVFGAYKYRVNRITVIENSGKILNSKNIKSKYKDISGTKDFVYGLKFGLGWYRFQLSARYYLYNKLFSNNIELPKLSIGFRVSF